MGVEGSIVVSRQTVPLAVRTRALQRFRDFTVVYIKVGETYEVRMLQLGRQTPEWTEVLGGLRAGIGIRHRQRLPHPRRRRESPARRTITERQDDARKTHRPLDPRTLVRRRRGLGDCRVLGVWSFQRLPIDATPDITNVQVQINTEAPGYSPLEAEQRLTFPIETAIAGLPGLLYTRSISRYGLSQVTVVFTRPDRHLFRAPAPERAAARCRAARPESRPISVRSPPAWARSSSTRSSRRRARESRTAREWTLQDLRTFQDWVIRPQLRTTPGVTDVNTIGGFERQYPRDARRRRGSPPTASP